MPLLLLRALRLLQFGLLRFRVNDVAMRGKGRAAQLFLLLLAEFPVLQSEQFIHLRFVVSVERDFASKYYVYLVLVEAKTAICFHLG